MPSSSRKKMRAERIRDFKKAREKSAKTAELILSSNNSKKDIEQEEIDYFYQLLLGRIKYSQRILLKNELIKEIDRVVCHNKDNKQLAQPIKELLELSSKRKCKFSDKDYLIKVAYTFIKIAIMNEKIIRPITEWECKSHNIDRQLISLVHHCFSIYPVPKFFDNVWLNSALPNIQLLLDKDLTWYTHVASGNNIRTAENLPLKLTKKAAHYMMMAPDSYSMPEAIRWGQILAMGGDERIVNGVLGTRLATDFSEQENIFWESVFKWFIDNPMLDPNYYGPLIDFFFNQKYARRIPDPEHPNFLIPVQPNFSMRQREVDATIKQMEEWHALNNLLKRKYKAEKWDSMDFKPFLYKEGKEKNLKIYEMVELLNLKDLIEEGKEMHHCVFSYGNSCASGNSSIWSLRVTDNFLGIKRLLTVEVNPNSMKVVQARKRLNQSPTPKDLEILKIWCNQNKIGIARWII